MNSKHTRNERRSTAHFPHHSCPSSGLPQGASPAASRPELRCSRFSAGADKKAWKLLISSAFEHCSASSMRFCLIRYWPWRAGLGLIHFAVRALFHATPKWIQAPIGPGLSILRFFAKRGPPVSCMLHGFFSGPAPAPASSWAFNFHSDL